MRPMHMQVFIDRLGDLDDEITKVCRASEMTAKELGKEHAESVGRLQDACKALQDKQERVREAKDHLLGFDAFLHAHADAMAKMAQDPKKGSFIKDVHDRMLPRLGKHVAVIVEESLEGLRRVGIATEALRESLAESKRPGSLEESAKALSKVCDVAEKTLRKALKQGPGPSPKKDQKKAEAEVEKAAGSVGFHGYQLTAKKELPPEFLENIKKKKEEAKDKEDADKKANSSHGYSLDA